ncbi:uncharacterized protein NEPG_01918 [Nematocida parisii ERTm1]|uniref:uncharacterized protein n=1 Tax=Nematocida parisii (strain ERTm1 / ATCC PRA-289) TaxID=881290 RepID=UPI000264BA0F|nr:uncharacterized protein NEPG_01918 [Nematocida parisii ERTm1]EIJ92963.1 hypothetical protein NEPG_01918 [Nematocida parisii ERTm1]|eukprot:XP_013059746.1 hypothetical protein NEPG_01918 [Nematocida parisii ERTm1]
MEQKSVFSRIKESIKNNHDNINDIFLHGMIRSVEQKVNIVKYFLIMNVKNTLPKNNSLVRFTNNLIGSTPLDDFETREHMLLYCMLNRDSKNYYPRIESCWEKVSRIAVYNCSKIVSGILYDSNYSLDVKLECFKKLMMVLANNNNKRAIITESFLINNIVNFSIKTNKSTEILLELIKIIYETVMQPDGSNIFVIYLRWIVKVGSGNYCNLKDKKVIIKILMNQIDVNYNFNLDNKWDSWIRVNYFNILEKLKTSKNLFCDEEYPEIVEKYDCLMSKISEIIELNKKRRSRAS